MSVASPSSLTAASPQVHWRKRLPPLSTCLLASFFIALVVIVQVFADELEPNLPVFDGAVVNVVSLTFSVAAFLTFYIWFVWLSPYTFATRRTIFAIPFGFAALAMATFRYEGVDGYMKPIFVPRWVRPHEATLAQNSAPVTVAPKVEPGASETPSPPPAARTIDLKTETPHDFPQFLGPQRNNLLPDTQLASDWKETPPREVWKRDIGPGWSGFAVRNGFAVTLEQRGDDEWVTCYDIATGELVWHHAAPGRHTEAVGGLGPRSTPAIDGGLVFVQGGTGLVRCLDGASGQLVWQDDLLERYGLTQADSEAAVKWGRAGSPLVAGELVIVPAGGKGANIRTLIAYHKESGQIAWEAGEDQISYASPVLATISGEHQIIYVSEKQVAGYDLNGGQQLWQYAWPSHSNIDANVSQGIPLPDDRVLVSKGYGVGAALLQLKKVGEQLQVDPLWESRRVLKTKYTNATVIAGFAYALNDGVLECVAVETGERSWRGGRYGHGQLLGVGDKLLVLGEDGDLMLVAADPQKFRQLGKIEALTGISWNNLCLSGKHLLIRNGKQAACYELP
jgi:outer membrane protein assembly factor BamB